jgi:hypothetical protein
LARFWERSTGGRDVAANLIASAHSAWPIAPRAAGMDAAIDWLRGGLEASELPRYLFLVGGPGAGKSHAAASVVRGLDAMDAESLLASRKYEYALGDSRLVVINDATISSDEYDLAPLSNELDASVRDRNYFMACVNRGILVEEAANLRRARAGLPPTPGSAIVEWLHSRASTVTRNTANECWVVEDAAGAQAYFRGGVLFDGKEEVAHLIAVYVDVNSLFEAAPVVLIESDVDLDIAADPYRVIDFAERMRDFSLSSPAGDLIAEVASMLQPSDQLGIIDPFSANASSLAAASTRAGVLSILRAAEIVSSQRMTYRELWGALSRCVIGDAYIRCNSDELGQFVLASQPAYDDSPAERFHKIRALAEFRMSQSLFGTTMDPAEIQRDPVLRLTHLVDPVRDAIPGYLDDHQKFGWASPVTDSFSSDAGNDSPLGTLLMSSHVGSTFAGIVTDFDRILDASYVAFVLTVISDRERQEVSAWYGGYLTRLYALSNGIPAFRSEVETWTSAWRLSKNLPKKLEEQLTTLLRPLRYPEKSGGAPLFPIFESRTNPVRGDQPIPKIAVRSEIGKITSRTESDSIFVEVAIPDREPTRMLLDFAMVREALACSHGHVGATELSETTSPRLERFRSMRLVPRNNSDTSDYRLVLAADDVTISVEAKQ